MHLRTTLKNSLRVWMIEIRLPGPFPPGVAQVRGGGAERRNCLQLQKATSPYDLRSASKCVSSGEGDGSTTGLSSRGPPNLSAVSHEEGKKKPNEEARKTKNKKQNKTTCEPALQEATAQHLRRGSLHEWPRWLNIAQLDLTPPHPPI